MDNKKNVPFQKNQLNKIFDVLGKPTSMRFPKLHIDFFTLIS